MLHHYRGWLYGRPNKGICGSHRPLIRQAQFSQEGILMASLEEDEASGKI